MQSGFPYRYRFDGSDHGYASCVQVIKVSKVQSTNESLECVSWLFDYLYKEAI